MGLPPTQLMRFLSFILCLVCAVAVGCSTAYVPPSTAPQSSGALSGSDEALARAFERRARDLQVEGQGVVQKVLSDDDDGRRHQRFVVALASSTTLLPRSGTRWR